jgi:large subunit ribosomal protein L21
VPKPDIPASAVVVSGGKQYRVAPGDRVVVDRLAAEPGSEIKLGRVLLLNDGQEVRVGSATDGLDVEARVIGHPRGPRIESIRYKSKKRVRVHRGGRADLTALEILTVGGIGLEAPAPKEEAAGKAARQKRGRAKVEATKAQEPAAEAQTAEAEAPKKTSRRRSKKESE